MAPDPSGPAPKACGTALVRSGDTLWAIALRRVGEGSDSARVAAELQRVEALNRSLLAQRGPDLILSGMRLQLPCR